MDENMVETASTELGTAMGAESETESISEPVTEVREDILPVLIEIDGHLVELSDYLKGRETENLSDTSVDTSVSSDELIASIQEVKDVVKVSNTIGLCIGFGIFLFIGVYFSYMVWRRM